MPTVTADSRYQLLQADRAAAFLLVNNDTASTVYVSQQRPVTSLDVQIPPQASAGLTGWWYVSTLNRATTVQCFILPTGVTWSNPVGVQIALSNVGIPPFVPGLRSKSMERQGPAAGGVFFTFTAAARVWGASVDLSIASSGAYTAGTTAACYARVTSSTPLTTLAITGTAIGNSSDQNSNGSDRAFPGLAVAAGDTLTLDVNGGSVVANAVITADCTVLFSVP